MPITIHDIASHLQLSTATVSRSLRNDPLIHPATRARVNEAAATMGYQGRSRRGPQKSDPNSGDGERGRANGRRRGNAVAGASGLVMPTGGRISRVLAVFLISPNSSYSAAHHSNFMRTLEGITSECDRLGLLTSLHTFPPGDKSLFADNPDRVPAVLRDHLCEAVLVTGRLPHDDVAWISRQVPTVTLSRIYEGLPADAVTADNVNGIRQLVRRLAERRHRRLAFVDDSYVASFFAERRAGFLQGCAENDIDAVAYLGPPAHAGEDTGKIAQRLRHLVHQEGVTGFVCANDLTAERVLSILNAARINVPEQVSVTGFDRSQSPGPGEMAAARTLATVDPNFIEMGRCAVRLALQRLSVAALPPLRVSIAPTILEGDTLGPAPDEGR